jgi:hypothetical protein
VCGAEHAGLMSGRQLGHSPATRSAVRAGLVCARARRRLVPRETGGRVWSDLSSSTYTKRPYRVGLCEKVGPARLAPPGPRHRRISSHARRRLRQGVHGGTRS